MGEANFSDDFKRDAVRQITERGYPVAEVSKRLSGSTRARLTKGPKGGNYKTKLFLKVRFY